jgi:hypothetical protein
VYLLPLHETDHMHLLLFWHERFRKSGLLLHCS